MSNLSTLQYKCLLVCSFGLWSIFKTSKQSKQGFALLNQKAQHKLNFHKQKIVSNNYISYSQRIYQTNSEKSKSLLKIPNITQNSSCPNMHIKIEQPYKAYSHPTLTEMQHLIAKTGLGVAVAHVIQQLGLQSDKDAINSLLIDVFTSKFQDFKRRHSAMFPPCTVVAYYIVENEYPVGENDMHQYFRCLANQVKIGNGNLIIGSNEDRRNFTIIEGYSRNQSYKKKNSAPKPPKSPIKKENSQKKEKVKMRQLTSPKPQKRLPSEQYKDFMKKKRRIGTKKAV